MVVILCTIHDLPDQHEKVAIVTGSNKGIGYETAKSLCKLGAHVIMACRSSVSANLAIEKIKKEIPNAQVEFIKLDLSRLSSVREFVTLFKKRKLPLHILINNAGVMITPYEKTEDGYELQFAINHLGHFALTLQLLDILNDTGCPDSFARIVNVSSDVHRYGTLNFETLNSSCGYCPYTAYQQSKLANILFTYELQRRLSAEGCQVTANALHPGIGDTELFQNVPPLVLTMQKYLVSWMFKPPSECAYTTLYVATSSCLEGLGGRYYDNSEEVQSSEESYNQEVQRRLWDISCDMTKISH
ncbi:dehydrogenase/reductase SDR family member on chromosome X-like isoform X2 [Dendronephthya gigantea]|uniref:dehydrogenase/reductase SDR family member on chromosome X-like isoform X2 n=1 Tax=Dendronephthya gigantea TaxID=151771 RepID=UPI00106A3244|nr:dehydrogenase/reductase SDR family member on chromosome X-like isoform X2 [Dendronephthya gigantea]